VFVTAGSLPSKYVGAIMVGRGVSGLFSNLLSLVTLPSLNHTGAFSAVTFFTVSGISSILASTFYCLVLKRNECFKFYVQNVREAICLAESGKFCDDSQITESEAQDIRVSSFRDFINATKRQFSSTQGILYTIFAVYFITYSVFPAVILHRPLKCVKNQNTAYLILLLLFNMGDLMGRILSIQRKLMVSIKTTKILTLLRLVFLCTFMLIAFDSPPT
jgi:hypothetical protein